MIVFWALRAHRGMNYVTAVVNSSDPVDESPSVAFPMPPTLSLQAEP